MRIYVAVEHPSTRKYTQKAAEFSRMHESTRKYTLAVCCALPWLCLRCAGKLCAGRTPRKCEGSVLELRLQCTGSVRAVLAVYLAAPECAASVP